MNFIYYLINLLIGTANVPKHDLRKRPTFKEAFYSFLERNFVLFAYLAVIFLLIMFVVVCYAIVGVSAVESGVPYNHIGDII
jgi:uncharacterized membrane protein